VSGGSGGGGRGDQQLLTVLQCHPSAQGVALFSPVTSPAPGVGGGGSREQGSGQDCVPLHRRERPTTRKVDSGQRRLTADWKVGSRLEDCIP
jgi:hypothetical protein